MCVLPCSWCCRLLAWGGGITGEPQAKKAHVYFTKLILVLPLRFPPMFQGKEEYVYIVYLRDLYMNFNSPACSYKNACPHPAALARFSTGTTLSRSDLEVDSRSIALSPHLCSRASQCREASVPLNAMLRVFISLVLCHARIF